LRGAKVIGAAEREQAIRNALDAATRTIPGARWREDKPLVATVVNLTDSPPSSWAASIRISGSTGRSAGHGDARPPEIFRHRRCERQIAAAFSGRAQHGRRLRGINPARQRTRSARPFQRCPLFLADGPEADLRQRVDLLRSVTFQKDLGSYTTRRCACSTSSSLAETVRQTHGDSAGVIHKAALLAKTDLTTELVKEFTELQGLSAGSTRKCRNRRRHKARRATGVSRAIYDHYNPNRWRTGAHND